MIDLENITKKDLDKLTLEQRLHVQKLIKELKERKSLYPILDFKPQTYQQEFLDVVAARNPDWTPKYKFIVFIGWNGTWKTMLFSYITQLIAMWDVTREYGLPYIWKAPIIKVVTSTWSQIMENIEPYMLWTSTSEDIIKFPWYYDTSKKGSVVSKVRKDKEVLKQVDLKNWTKIFYWSYDQWQARLQGWSPDLTWIDEVPTRRSDFRELIRGTRKKNAQFIMSFTPTNYNKKIYDWIYGGQANKYVRQVDAFENKMADHSWMEGLSEEELQIVRFWKFVPPTWLVYKSFSRQANSIEHFNPRELWNDLRFYWALDFGVKHPMAFLFIVVDSDNHVYIFDMIYWSNILLADLMKQVEKKKQEYWIDFEWIVADSQDARARAELKAMWMRTIPANKRTKWDNNLSNRKAWILKINQMCALGEIIVSTKCEALMEEFETHHYAEKWQDWTVVKENDDALDALRYFIFNYRIKNELKRNKKDLNKKRRELRNWKKKERY